MEDMIILVAKIVHWAFLVFTMLMLARIIGSWFPRYTYHPIMMFCRKVTDPYLNVFRRLIPPIGGALDLSPMIGFFVLQFLEKMVLGFLSAII
jgi:YggT family protein